MSELAERAHVRVKAVRYYEQLGFVTPTRAPNDYRVYSVSDVSVVAEVRELSALGISPGKAHAFIEGLGAGHRTPTTARARWRFTATALPSSIA